MRSWGERGGGSTYPESLHPVALRPVPLDNQLAQVQEKHIAAVEALPGHFHLQSRGEGAWHSHLPCHWVSPPQPKHTPSLASVLSWPRPHSTHLSGHHVPLALDVQQPLDVVGVGLHVLHA